MDSIVLELQREAMASNSNVSDLLRKSLVIARKLNNRDFEEWARQELNGYMDNLDNIPDYREITGSLQWFNQVRGWCPAFIQNPEAMDTISKSKVAQSVTDLEYLVNADSGGELILKIPQATQNELCQAFGRTTIFQLSLGKNQVQNIIEKVKNIILDWSIRLEEDGILGEGIKFTQEEKEEANQQNYTVNNFYGHTSGVQIQQHTQHSTQTQINELDLEKVSTFISNLQSYLTQTGLNSDHQEVIRSEIDNIVNELKDKKPKTQVVKESLRTIRSLLEGVAGNFIAQASLSEISQLGLFM